MTGPEWAAYVSAGCGIIVVAFNVFAAWQRHRNNKLNRKKLELERERK